MTKIETGELTLYYSYETLIAFEKNGKLTIRQNAWKTTTGKHLNYIDDDKSKRVDKDTFEREYTEAMEGPKLEDEFNLKIDLGNAEMLSPENVADALGEVSEKLGNGQMDGIVRDINGNTVGSFSLVCDW